MHRTRVLLRDWFWAAYLVTTHTPGFSAWQLQRQLGRRRTPMAAFQSLLGLTAQHGPTTYSGLYRAESTG